MNARDPIIIWLHVLYGSFLSSLFFSWRAVSVISIAAILVTGIIFSRKTFKASAWKKEWRLFILSCSAFFLLTLISMLYTRNIPQGWEQVRIQSGLIVTPLAVYLTAGYVRGFSRFLIRIFTGLAVLASLLCLINATLNFIQDGRTGHFFYHELVAFLEHHAVYFSILIFAAIVLTWFMDQTPRWIRTGAILILSGVLVLLASKLVIAFYILFILHRWFMALKQEKKKATLLTASIIVFILGLVFLFVTWNPVSQRFRDIVNTDLSILKKDRYDPGDYFSGLQFRIVSWKWVSELLNEKKAWLRGVSAGDAKDELHKKYIQLNLYTGENGTSGYLDYNPHNQFLQSLLQHGIAGLLVFLLSFISLGILVWRLTHTAFRAITLLMLCYAMVESVFETQYGIILYSFLPVFTFQLFPVRSRFVSWKATI